MTNQIEEGPFHCGPRMAFVPGFAKERFRCENCGALAIRKGPGRFTIYQSEEHLDRVLKSKKNPSPLLGFFDFREKPAKEDR